MNGAIVTYNGVCNVTCKMLCILPLFSFYFILFPLHRSFIIFEILYWPAPRWGTRRTNPAGERADPSPLPLSCLTRELVVANMLPEWSSKALNEYLLRIKKLKEVASQVKVRLNIKIVTLRLIAYQHGNLWRESHLSQHPSGTSETNLSISHYDVLEYPLLRFCVQFILHHDISTSLKYMIFSVGKKLR